MKPTTAHYHYDTHTHTLQYRFVAKSVKIKVKYEQKFTEARKYSITLRSFRNVL